MKDEKTNNHTFIKILISVILIIIVVILYSRFGATKGLDINEYKINNQQISDNFYGFKIAHISDIHYGQTVNHKELGNLVKEINLLKPDIVVLTGDLLDKDKDLTDEDINIINSELSKINATVGKYAVKGDNDAYFNNWKDIIISGGFKDISDNYELIYNNGYTPILLAGIGTNDANTIKDTYVKTEEFINSSDEFNNIYKILLIHEPDLIDNINYSDYNLILAGHSLNGQINIPLINDLFLPNNAKKYHNGYYKLSSSELYISNGVGTTNFKFRLFNKPSISLYRLSNK